MRPEERDAAYIWDILDAAQSICDFTAGVKYHQYLGDRMLQLAIERSVEIIGEAARRVSETFKQAHPEIPWRLMIAQRNVLAHEYGEIKQERMWALITTHVPALLGHLEAAPSSSSIYGRIGCPFLPTPSASSEAHALSQLENPVPDCYNNSGLLGR